ncbi:MAG: hypothetical protein N3A60_03330 [Thermanaerothrix sp.]|nr:hypothetical protein [Thermanaerothrix sp.]
MASWLPSESNLKTCFQRWAPYVLLGVLWSTFLLVHFRFGTKVIGAFFLGLALMLLLLRRRWKPLLVASLAATILLTTGVADTWVALRDSTLILAMDIKKLVLVFDTPGSGMEVVPQEARQAAELLAEVGTSTYRLSPALMGNALFEQRIVEVVWPRRLEPISPYYLYLHQSEALPGGCTLIAQREHVALAHCP